MFFDAIDFNTEIPELQITLPSYDELPRVSEEWSDISTAFDLFKHNVGAVDGWLPFITSPSVPNQADYFSGHYQTHGLNVQAMCRPDLTFDYICVAGPGKTNDNRTMDRCTDLRVWLDIMPNEYYAVADNAYVLSQWFLIPFTTPELAAAGDQAEFYRTFNFYLSQLRIWIEMAFGGLCTNW